MVSVEQKDEDNYETRKKLNEEKRIATYNTIQYNTIQCNTIQYNTMQHNSIQYNRLNKARKVIH